MKERELVCLLLLHWLGDANELQSLQSIHHQLCRRGTSPEEQQGKKAQHFGEGALTPMVRRRWRVKPFPSLFFLCFSFNTTGKTHLFPSLMSTLRACSTGQKHTQPPGPSSLGTPGCHHPVEAAASPSSQHFAGSELSTPLVVAGAA